MSLPRLDYPTHIADRLNELASKVKSRSRASLTDANHILETIAKRFFNALFGWNLVNLNLKQANYPAADLGDRKRRVAIQITNQEGAYKITHTAAKAAKHGLGKDFDELIVFFLLSRKPNLPKKLCQSPKGPKIKTWDIADLLKQMREMEDIKTLAKAAKVLDEELGEIREPEKEPNFDISRILEHAPADLVGREEETKLLNDAWASVQNQEKNRPRVLTFVALDGEGKSSLVAKWAAELARQDWPGCDSAFAWSFYNQTASSDLFLKEALTFFGDADDRAFAASPVGALEKGQRLAHLVGQRRSLLVLDGLEPLQYPTEVKAFKPGELKDEGIAKLLKALASSSLGLCLVTTRIELPDLNAFKGGAVVETCLRGLPRASGVKLLKKLGLKGSEFRNILLKAGDERSEKVNEFEKLVEDVKGHALTLTLLGEFIRRAFHGDIRQRDRVKFEKADEKIDGGHAFRTMAAYEQWLLSGGDEGRREVAVLRLMGLFDRPAAADCLAALRREPIPGLTEPLAGLADDDWEYCLSGLESTRLLTVNRDTAGALVSLDAHPHVRAYFAKRLSEDDAEAWRAGHKCLYEHLCKTTSDNKAKPTLEDLQPLYQAVAHGCRAGMHNEACNDVYRGRILRGQQCYSTYSLGAVASDLSALCHFFENQWNRLTPTLCASDQAWLFNETAYSLRALGRLTEALDAMKAAVNMSGPEDWEENAIRASNLSQLELLMGLVEDAVSDAEQAGLFSDKSVDAFQRMCRCTTHADALYQAGKVDEAARNFRALEEQEAKRQPDRPQLYSVAGFRFCDLILAPVERLAWKSMLNFEVNAQALESATGSCLIVQQRVTQALRIAEGSDRCFELALDHLSLCRIAACRAALNHSSITATQIEEMNQTVARLRTAVTREYLIRGLLARAWLRFLAGACTGPESAQEDLNQAWEIAERGPMKLFMADIHLHRARLFFCKESYPWKEAKDRKGEFVANRTAKDDFDDAGFWINTCGYHRRDDELDDAKCVILGA
jgi:tetratricopeptide (TPR) repeat protein